MNDKEYNYHLRSLFNILLNEKDEVAYTAKEILFNTYGLIVFKEEIMTQKRRNKIAHGR